MKRSLISLAVLCGAGLAAASPVLSPPSVASVAGPASAVVASEAVGIELPPADLVRDLILSRPEVRAASQALLADQAEARRLVLGPHEYTVRLSGQQRRARETSAEGPTLTHRYGEAQLAFERAWRTGSKADKDGALGEASVALGQARRADAIHEASRQLLRAWVDWLRERATVELWREQAADEADLSQHADRRVRAGDAARTELMQQQARQAQRQASLMGAQAREAIARATLDALYPGLTRLAEASLQRPLGSQGGGADAAPSWQDQASIQQAARELASHSHELPKAEAEREVARVRAERQALERRADPTLGVYVSSERSGSERVLGVSMSLPLAGEARTAAQQVALAQAQEAIERAEAVRRQVQAEALAAALSNEAAQTTWRHQELARQRQQQVLATVQRGWQLGELSHLDVLLARRQYVEVALAEIAARADARHAFWRQQLDLHDLWKFDEE